MSFVRCEKLQQVLLKDHKLLHKENKWNTPISITKEKGNQENHQDFLDTLHTQLGYKCMDDWYKVTKQDILKNGGGGFLHYYQSSPSSALLNVYPEHNWELERFKNKPSKLWIKHQAQRI